ncbi:hypothetical protein HMPREF9441_03312 [Paraprevotella clara YIT 11840]|uniref:Uncharacterized protein n=1 Tax=Paraprevotella clara YIT 11840 TaxID=762968 RepID=G5SVD8_9BACT|nr:hypothetical protein HMPREF9441_03312 [Paraprevotella clara YIT 11840]
MFVLRLIFVFSLSNTQNYSFYILFILNKSGKNLYFIDIF